MSTITRGATTLEPDLVLELEASAEMSTIKHSLIGGGVSYSLRTAEPRAGRLLVFFLTRADAFECFNEHLEPGVWVYTDTDNPEQSMSYVTLGRIRPQLDLSTRRRWTVEIEYGEVIV